MDKEKVIAWLAEEELYYREKQDATKDDLYNSKMAFYALALLKEQPEIVRCKDCEYCYTEGFVHERLVCEKHPEFCDLKEDWYCADGWKDGDGE